MFFFSGFAGICDQRCGGCGVVIGVMVLFFFSFLFRQSGLIWMMKELWRGVGLIWMMDWGRRLEEGEK